MIQVYDPVTLAALLAADPDASLLVVSKVAKIGILLCQYHVRNSGNMGDERINRAYDRKFFVVKDGEVLNTCVFCSAPEATSS